MKEIPLNKGMIAIVDDEDYERVNQYTWFMHTAGYAIRHGKRRKGERSKVFMHHEINGYPEMGMQVDHINRNPLDNRKSNLRFCSVSQNQANTTMHVDNTSGKKGVTWHKRNKKWQAQIMCGGKHNYLGQYDNLELANTAYEEAAKRLFGDYALLNNG